MQYCSAAHERVKDLHFFDNCVYIFMGWRHYYLPPPPVEKMQWCVYLISVIMNFLNIAGKKWHPNMMKRYREAFQETLMFKQNWFYSDGRWSRDMRTLSGCKLLFLLILKSFFHFVHQTNSSPKPTKSISLTMPHAHTYKYTPFGHT